MHPFVKSLYASTVLLLSLSTVSCKLAIGQSESFSSLLKRMETWGVKLPNGTKTLAKYYRSYLGWDNPDYFHIYYAFSLEEEPTDLLPLFTASVDEER